MSASDKNDKQPKHNWFPPVTQSMWQSASVSANDPLVLPLPPSAIVRTILFWLFRKTEVKLDITNSQRLTESTMWLNTAMKQGIISVVCRDVLKIWSLTCLFCFDERSPLGYLCWLPTCLLLVFIFYFVKYMCIYTYIFHPDLCHRMTPFQESWILGNCDTTLFCFRLHVVSWFH